VDGGTAVEGICEGDSCVNEERKVVNTNRFVYFSAVLVLAILRGCRGNSIDSMTLYSLDGTFDLEKKPEGEVFHGYPVLGKTQLESAEDRRIILAAAKKGIAEREGDTLKCFWPRHGVRAVQNGNTTDYLICFECKQLSSYLNGEFSSHENTSRTPQATIDAHLKKAGVPQQRPAF
jgi:hypothetical protein